MNNFGKNQYHLKLRNKPQFVPAKKGDIHAKKAELALNNRPMSEFGPSTTRQLRVHEVRRVNNSPNVYSRGFHRFMVAYKTGICINKNFSSIPVYGRKNERASRFR
jgi:hypothetical protein